MLKKTLVVVSALALLAACNRTNNEAATNQAGNEVAQQPDAHPAATIPTPANEAAAPDFVQKAAMTDMYEIAAAKIAQKRSTNAEVKKFAAQMIKDHTKSTADLKKAIADSGQALTPPAQLDEHTQGQIDDLNKADAKDFDKAYMNDQVDAHQGALDVMQRYANDGDVPAIKTFAANTASVVQMHYDMAKSLRDKVEGKSDANPTKTPAAKNSP
jgi:putative membrane protein